MAATAGAGGRIPSVVKDEAQMELAVVEAARCGAEVVLLKQDSQGRRILLRSNYLQVALVWPRVLEKGSEGSRALITD